MSKSQIAWNFIYRNFLYYGLFAIIIFGILSTLPRAHAEKERISGKIVGSSLLETSPESKTLEKDPQRKTVIIFLSAKCPCSNSHIDELKDLAKKYTQFQFLGIHSNTDEPTDFSRPYFQRVELPFPILSDPDQKMADLFKSSKTPHSFILSENNEILYQGGVSDSHELSKAKIKYLRLALQELSEGKSVAIERSRTLGCVIARREKNVW